MSGDGVRRKKVGVYVLRGHEDRRSNGGLRDWFDRRNLFAKLHHADDCDRADEQNEAPEYNDVIFLWRRLWLLLRVRVGQ